MACKFPYIEDKIRPGNPELANELTNRTLDIWIDLRNAKGRDNKVLFTKEDNKLVLTKGLKYKDQKKFISDLNKSIGVKPGQNPVVTSEPSEAYNGREVISVHIPTLVPYIDVQVKQKQDAKLGRYDEDDNLVFDDIPFNKVDYSLKAVNILSSDKAKQIFDKGNKNNWDLNKILTELQIPKLQRQLILDNGITNREDIITNLLANYSYIVEINTGKSKVSLQQLPSEIDGYKIGNDFYKRIVTPDFNYVHYKNGNIISEIEFNNIILEKDSQYYSNLTVPGGTNYTENEIATPAIIPSIKGHAQFATDKGIGWFRSDEQIVSEKDKQAEIEAEKQLQEDIEQGYAEPGMRALSLNSGEGSKTRRILEVQSDLFQKGRDKKTLSESITGDSFILNNELYEQPNPYKQEYIKSKLDENYQQYDYKELTIHEYLEAKDEFESNNKENQFLQLLNKDNNWVTFFIKSIIQDSTKKGYEKVLFPSGNTASKVEGHTTLEEFKREKENRVKSLEATNEKIDKGTFNASLISSDPNYSKELYAQNIIEIKQLKQELERVEKEGFGALRPIYNFYENTVTNILKKQGYNPELITDEYGNTWNEVKVSTPNQVEFTLDDLPFHLNNESKSKIKDGSKSLSIRPSYTPNKVITIEGKQYKITNKGLMTLDEFSDQSLLNVDEIKDRFIGDEEIKYEHIKEWFDGNISMYIYDIKPIEDTHEDIPTMDKRFFKEIERLERLIERLDTIKRKKIAPEVKELITEQLKGIKQRLKFLKDIENQTLGTILAQAEGSIKDAVKLFSMSPENGRIAVSMVHPYLDILDQFDVIDKETRDRINLYKDAINQFIRNVNIAEHNKVIGEAESYTGQKLAFNGDLKAFEDDSALSKYTMSASSSTNPLVQTATRKLQDAVSKVNDDMNSFDSEHKKLVDDLVKYQKDNRVPKDNMYDFMIQELDGKRTGLYVVENSAEYFKAKADAKDQGDLEYAKFMALNHDYDINTAQWDKFKEWVDTLTTTSDNPEVSNEEATARYRKAILRKTDPETMIKLLNRLKRGGILSNKELDFINNYTERGNWKFIKFDSHDSWKDSKYEALQRLDDSHPLKAFYNHFISTMKEDKNELGSYYSDNYKFYNLIPVLKNATKLYDIKGMLKNELTANIDPDTVMQDPITGETIHNIPVYTLSSDINPEFRNYDLDKVLKTFHKEVLTKKYMEEIEDDVNATINVLRNAEFVETNAFGNVKHKVVNGQIVPVTSIKPESTSLMMLEYMRDALMYGRHQDKEIGLKKTLSIDKDKLKKELKDFKLKSALTTATTFEKKDILTVEALKTIKKFKNLQKERGITKEQLKFNPYEGLEETEIEEYKKAEGDTVAYYGSKAANLMIKYTALKALGFYWVGGVAEFFQGVFSNFTESSSNEFFNDNDMVKGYGTVIKALHPAKREKVQSLLKALNVVKPHADTEVVGQGTKVTNVLMGHLHIADFTSKGATAFAVLNKEGLLDRIDIGEDGFILIDGKEENEFVKIVDGKKQYTDAKRDLEHKINEITTRIHSRDNNKPIRASKSAIGRLITQFRGSWMFQGVERRFGKEKEIPLLKTKVKGFYRSVLFPDNGNFNPMLSLNTLVKSSVFGKLMGAEIGNEVSEVDKANFKKFARELSFMATSYIMFTLLSKLRDDDDDKEMKKDKLLNWAINQTYRSNRDLTFYISPENQTEVLGGNIAPAVKSLMDLYKVVDALIQNTAYGISGGAIGDPYVYEGTSRQANKFPRAVRRAIPGVAGTERTWTKLEKLSSEVNK